MPSAVSEQSHQPCFFCDNNKSHRRGFPWVFDAFLLGGSSSPRIAEQGLGCRAGLRVPLASPSCRPGPGLENHRRAEQEQSIVWNAEIGVIKELKWHCPFSNKAGGRALGWPRYKYIKNALKALVPVPAFAVPEAAGSSQWGLHPREMHCWWWRSGTGLPIVLHLNRALLQSCRQK